MCGGKTTSSLAILLRERLSLCVGQSVPGSPYFLIATTVYLWVQWPIVGAAITEDSTGRFGNPFSFSVINPSSGKALVLQCCNAAEREKWVAALRKESENAVCYEGALLRLKKIKRVCCRLAARLASCAACCACAAFPHVPLSVFRSSFLQKWVPQHVVMKGATLTCYNNEGGKVTLQVTYVVPRSPVSFAFVVMP